MTPTRALTHSSPPRAPQEEEEEEMGFSLFD